MQPTPTARIATIHTNHKQCFFIGFKEIEDATYGNGIDIANGMPEYCRMETSPENDRHFRALERMYNSSAAINDLTGHRVAVSEARATVIWQVNPQFFHAAGSLHGSMYFKMLDDAAFFAANSIEREVFVLTATMNVQLFRPVTGGSLVAHGWVTVPGRTLIHAHSEIRDDRDRLIAAGQGTFTRSTVSLMGLEGYRSGYEHG